MAELVGKAGSMMAAVLESAGYIYQAKVLDDMQTAFEGSVGGFIFLIGLVIGLTTFAVKGSFRVAPWLLIGPPMFFAVILPRTTIQQAQWRFGQQERDQSKVMREIRDITGEEGSNILVSKLFANYVRLVSETIQETVKRINRIGSESDRQMVFRGDMLSLVYSPHLDSDSFYMFVQQAFFHGCRDYIDAAAMVENTALTPTETLGARTLLGERYSEFRTDARVVLGPDAAAYLESLASRNPGTEYDEIARARNREAQKRLTCEQVWQVVRRGVIDYGVRRVEAIRRTIRANKMQEGRILRNLEEALFGPLGGSTPPTGNDAPQIPTGQEVAASINRIVRVVARYVLRNEFTAQSFAPEMLRNRNDLGVNASVEVIDDNDLHRVEQARVASMEWSEKTRMMTAAENLPYYQGLLLYFLGLAFPFFALCLVIPGKHAGFILWFVLWLWVKTWDVGLAVVALLDQLLFTLFAFHREVQQQPNQQQALNDAFGMAMFAMKNTDPTFQLTTYYNILATGILSIPIITSQMILGSLTGGAGLVAAGMGMMAQHFAGGAQVAQQQTTVSELRFRQIDLRRARMEATNDMMWNRAPLTPWQRSRYQDQRAPGAAEYRRDVLEFGNLADRISMARAELRGQLREELRNGQARGGGRTGVDGLPLPPPRPPGNGAARMFAYPVGYNARGLHQDPSKFDKFFRAFDQVADEMQRSRQIYESMREAERASGGVDWGAFGGPAAQQRELVRGWLRAGFGAQGSGRGWQWQTFNEATNELEVDGAVLYQWLMFNENYSAQGQDLAGMARVWGMLEVPWTENSGAPQDDAYLMWLRRREVNTDIAALGAIWEMASDRVPLNAVNANQAIRAALNDAVTNGQLSAQRRDELFRALDRPFITNFFNRGGGVNPETRWFRVPGQNPDVQVGVPEMRSLLEMFFNTDPPPNPPP